MPCWAASSSLALRPQTKRHQLGINKPTCRNSPRGREKTRGEELVAVRAVDFEEVWSETARFGNVGLKEVQEATDETCVVADFGARDSDLICVFSRTVGGCRGTGC